MGRKKEGSNAYGGGIYKRPNGPSSPVAASVDSWQLLQYWVVEAIPWGLDELPSPACREGTPSRRKAARPENQASIHPRTKSSSADAVQELRRLRNLWGRFRTHGHLKSTLHCSSFALSLR